MKQVKVLDPVQAELFKLAAEKRQQALQAAHAEMQGRVKVIADAHGLPEGTVFNVEYDDAAGTFALVYDDGAAEQPALALVDGGEGAED